MSSTGRFSSAVLLVAVSAVLFLSCGETETDTGAAPGPPALTAPEPRDIPPLLLTIEKYTNDVDADLAPGPSIPVGGSVEWKYVITNLSNDPVINIVVNDDKLGVISCPQSELLAGHSMTCYANGTAEPGQYENVATVSGFDPAGNEHNDQDPSHYLGMYTEIDIEKSTNGMDADLPPGPSVPVGDPVAWEYVVTNTGNMPLYDITVSDDILGTICTLAYLAPGGTATCTATGTAAAGQYRNVGTAVSYIQGGPPVTDADTSHYFGVEAGIDLEKHTNAQDADTPTGPVVQVGDPVTWMYIVTNVGNVPLTNIEITDDRLGAICLREGPLAPGDTVMCSALGTATAGQYANVGRADGTAPDGTVYTDEDPSHYYGEVPAGDDGCSHGYWKNHAADWPPTGYSPRQLVRSVFGAAAAYPDIGSATLMQALKFGGGNGVEGGARNLLKQAVASLLNAAHPAVMFPRTESEVISAVNAALVSGSRDTMINLAGDLDYDNNLGCPFDDDNEQQYIRIPAQRR